MTPRKINLVRGQEKAERVLLWNDACATSQAIYSGKFYQWILYNCTFRCQIMSNIWVVHASHQYHSGKCRMQRRFIRHTRLFRNTFIAGKIIIKTDQRSTTAAFLPHGSSIDLARTTELYTVWEFSFQIAKVVVTDFCLRTACSGVFPFQLYCRETPVYSYLPRRVIKISLFVMAGHHAICSFSLFKSIKGANPAPLLDC